MRTQACQFNTAAADTAAAALPPPALRPPLAAPLCGVSTYQQHQLQRQLPQNQTTAAVVSCWGSCCIFITAATDQQQLYHHELGRFRHPIILRQTWIQGMSSDAQAEGAANEIRASGCTFVTAETDQQQLFSTRSCMGRSTTPKAEEMEVWGQQLQNWRAGAVISCSPWAQQPPRR